MAAERLPSTGAAPSTTTPTTTPTSAEWGCDTADLVMFHRFLRMVFRDAATMIDTVAEGDRHRTDRVTRHLRQIAHALHAHHHGEDIFLWDDLERRTPACAVHVGQMRAQHLEIARHLEDLLAKVDAWSTSAKRTGADAVGASLAQLNATLGRHLDREETEIMPVASASFTQTEWGRLEQHGRRAVPPRWAFMQLAFMLESMPDAEQTAFLQHLPAPARAAWNLVGRRSFDRYRSRLLASAS